MPSRVNFERIREKMRQFAEEAKAVSTVEDAENLCMTGREFWGAFFPDWQEYLEQDEAEVLHDGTPPVRSFLQTMRDAVSKMEVTPADGEMAGYRDHAVASTRCRANAIEILINGEDPETAEEMAMSELANLLTLP